MLNSLVGIIASSGGAAAAPAYESIATITPTGTSTITFSSIPSTYTSLQLRMSVITATAGANLQLRLNGDTGTNYARHFLFGNGASVSASGNASVSTMYIDTSGTRTTSPMVSVIDLHDYASTTRYKTVRMLVGCDNNGAGEIDLMSGLWMNTSAVNSLTIFATPTYNYSAGTTFALYGIKGA
jgi:hypothetical protein